MKPDIKYNIDEDLKDANSLLNTSWAITHLVSSPKPKKTIITNNIVELKYYKLIEKLNSFYAIKDNWDNEGSFGIAENTIGIAHNLLKSLKALELIENQISIHVFPTLDSGIQFELDSDAIKADIEIFTDGKIELTVYNLKGEIINQEKYDCDTIEPLILNLEGQVYDYAF